MTIRTKRVTLLLLAIFSSTFISLAPLSTYTAQAAAPDPSTQLEKWLYYRGMRACLNNPDFDNIVPVDDNGSRTSSEINDGHWLPGSDGDQPDKGFGYLAPDMDSGDDGTISCNDGSVFARGASAFGFSNPVALLCAMNRALSPDDNGRITPSHPTDCEQSDKFDFDGGGGSVFQSALTKALSDEGSKDRPAFNINDNNGPDYSYKALLYLIGKHSLEIFCGNGATLEAGSANGGDIGSKDIVSVDIVKPDGTIDTSKPYPLANSDRDEGSTVNDIYYNQGGDTNNAQDLTCAEMASMTRDNSTEYAKWVRAHPELVQDQNDESNPQGDNAAVCSAGALGWVLCPLSEAMVGAIQGIANILESLLVFQPLTNSDQGKAIKTIWGSLLGIANAGLIIAFLVVVFSQATSIGLNNYGIKKLLPRVIAAAILMNLSFYICAIAVDISNILGVSVKAIVDSGLNQLNQGNVGNPDVYSGAGIGQYIAVSAGALLVAGIAAATGAIFLLLPMLVSGLMAILTAFLIIAARQVLITLLIIVSPLAILAWILPNTESWFTKWRKLFTLLLLMFPMVMAIFYGAVLVSSVMLIAGQSGDAMKDFTIKLMAFLVLVIPLFSLPFVMKAAGGVLERFGVMVNNRNKGLVDRSRKKSEELKGRTSYQRGRGIRQQSKQDFRNKKFAGRLNLANKSFEDYKAENGGNLSATQVAQWTRAQQTKGLAGGVGEIARMSGRGAENVATKGVSGLYGVSPTLGDLGAKAVVGAGKTVRGTAGLVPGGDMRRAQTEALNRGAQAQEAKAFNERVAAIQTTYDNMGSVGADTAQFNAATGAGYLEGQYKQAIETGNHEQAAAVINRLSNLGAGGRNRLSNMLQTHAVTDDKMKDTVTKAVVQDNYGSLVGSRSDAAKGSFGTTGTWNTSGALGKVGTGQLATQDEKTLYQNFGDISIAEATKIMAEPNLETTVQNAKARAILRARASGTTALPTSGLIDPTDPTLGSWSDLVS